MKKMKDILRALRNACCPQKRKQKSIQDHPFFGMYRGEIDSVEKKMQELRKPRQ